MKSVLTLLLLLVVASGVEAAECTSTSAMVFSEPATVVRVITWNGLKETLELKGAEIASGKYQGEKMKSLSLKCTFGTPQTVCESVTSGRTNRAVVEGISVVETVALKTGVEVGRIVYACDKPPLPKM